ncbi:MAG: hypothetical protein F6K09_05105 [Merismopedia sp. SIO2A8]|nr:hypothetical protein [Merismopedia sp. SIO2A8]
MRQHQDLRDEAAQAFEASMHQLEERLLETETTEAEPQEEPDKPPLPLKTEDRLPFCFSASATLCQQDFDLESLQEAAADIDQFIQHLH